MELLSPAGSMESLRTAVMNGADAVYFGGTMYNARRNAGNFDDDEMKSALRYCRARGVHTYITLNTLLFDRELDSAVSYARFLSDEGASAVIVQDIGLVRRLVREVPSLTLHASTQMGIHDAEGAALAKKLGFARVVLSREVPLDEIANIRENVDIELEAFAHGALCMSFSGGCLFSSMAGERSGNRGTCAQPCRKRIAVGNAPNDDDYALSLSDLCMIEHIGDMKDAGVSCIKLEGRMKRAEYVAIVTRAYRAAIDGAPKSVIQGERAKMVEMFDRGGLRTGYYYGDSAVTGCVAVSEPSEALLREARETYEKETRKREVTIKCSIKAMKKPSLTMSADGVSVSVTGEENAALAQKPQDKARYEAQLMKLGDTPFFCKSIALDMDDSAFMPVSAQNELRRRAVEALENALYGAQNEASRASLLTADGAHRETDGETLIHALVRGEDEARAAFLAGADEVAIEPVDYLAARETLEALSGFRKKAKLLLSLPNVVISREEHERIDALLHSGLVDGAVANNIGQAELIAHLPLRIAGAAMNALNAETVRAYYALGFDRVTLSVELTKPQMRDILRSAGGAVEIYSRTPLMQLLHCPVKEKYGCRNCKGDAGELIDEAKRRFPLSNVRQAGSCLVRVLNCVVTDITDLAFALPRMEAVSLIMRTESADEVELRVKNALFARSGGETEAARNATRGHFTRAVD